VLFLGVDGGATKTVAVVANEEGELLGKGFSGPVCYHLVGVVRARENLRRAVEGALREAGITWEEIDGICYGLSSVEDSPKDTEVIKRFSSEVTPKPFTLVNDVVNAYYATTYGEPGVAVVAGTGSIAYGRNREGLEVRVGGWGQLVGDEGSSVYIAKRGLQEACKGYDGRGKWTSLVKLIPKYLGLNDLREVTHKIMVGELDFSELGKLAQVVVKASEIGDDVARKILEEAGEELALHAIAALRRLRLRGKVIVGASGGVFKSGVTLWNAFSSKLRKEYPEARLVGPIYGAQPVAGAVLLASIKAGRKMEIKALRALLETLKEVEL